MRFMLPVGLALVLQAASQPAGAAPQPVPPRHGRHTVQAMFGGRTVIPMCIVPPREYVDGTPIPEGTNCTIVVYRSKDEGRPGTYTQEVGRGQGPIEREWIDVGADVPCDDPKGGVIYLASCAIINGEWSDLNNQYTTIIWSPGQFDIKDYPAAGSNPGSPPGRKPVRTGPEQYPSWLKEIGDAARGAGGGGDGGYTVETLPLMEYHEELGGLDLALKLRLAVAPDGTLSGDTDLEPLLTLIRDLLAVTKVEVPRNEVTGRLAGGSLNAKVVFAVTIHTEFADQNHVRTIHADTALNSNGQQGETIRGQARTTVSYSGEEGAPAPSTKNWDFVAEPQGSGGLRLLAPGTIEGSEGPVPLGFQTPASQSGGGVVGQEWQDRVAGYISLSVGDSHFFALPGTAPNAWLDPTTGQWVRGLSFQRVPGDVVRWIVRPRSVLEEEPVGSGMRVRATRDGMGEVWGTSKWQAPLADGRTATGRLVCIWIVPVGGEAVAQLKGGGGGTKPDNMDPPESAIAGVKIKGSAVLKGPARTPVAGALVSLVYLPTGGAYEDPTWLTDGDGKIRITVGTGLPPGEYEVMVQKRNRDTAVIGPDEDLWPMRRYIINVTAAAAKAGPIAVGTSIKMDRVKNIDFNLRDRRPVRAGAE